MAEAADIVSLLTESVGSINRNLNNLATNVVSHGLPAVIPNFDGSNSKKYKDWIKSIEKYGRLNAVDPTRFVLIAYPLFHKLTS